jgi:hypothetical protein
VRCDPAARMKGIIRSDDRQHRNAATQIAPIRAAGLRLRRSRSQHGPSASEADAARPSDQLESDLSRAVRIGFASRSWILATSLMAEASRRSLWMFVR